MSNVKMNFTGIKSTLAQRVWRLLYTGRLFTMHELAEKSFTTHRTLDSMTRLFHECGLIRIHEWRQAETTLVAYWGFGPGEHAPKKVKVTDGLSTTVSGAAKAVKLALAERDMVASEVVSLIDYNPDYVERVMRHMAYKTNEIHVIKWLRNRAAGGAMTPIYRLGQGANAEKPTPIKPVQANRDWRKRIKSQFDSETAKRILASRGKGGVERVVRDGKTLYQRRGYA